MRTPDLGHRDHGGLQQQGDGRVLQPQESLGQAPPFETNTCPGGLSVTHSRVLFLEP